MRFEPTAIDGPCVVHLEPHADDRGSFARVFCAREFAAHGLIGQVAQTNLSHNHAAGTLRGLHWQRPPAGEAKLLRCVKGAIFDVAVDVRDSSPTFLRHVGVELTAENRLALYVPPGFAHGFQTLEDDVDVLYQVSEFYTPGAEAGLRHDDPALGISWPLPVTAISDKDATWPLLAERGGRP